MSSVSSMQSLDGDN